jgi:hypothetical protein
MSKDKKDDGKNKGDHEFAAEFAPHLKTPEAALAFAKALRAAADFSRRKFLSFLLEVEARPALWDKFGPTFATYLTNEHIVRACVYEEWKIGNTRVSVAVAEEIGVHAVRQLARAQPGKVRECVGKMREAAQKEKVPLSSFRASNIVNEFAPPRPARDVSGPSPAQLVRENEKLKAKLAKADAREAAYKAKLARYEAENASLKEQLREATGKPRRLRVDRERRSGDAHPDA